jgi:predicted nucleic acid-binding protein
VIYLDSSVALAHLLVEDRRPSASLWADLVLSSRLLEYEVWCRLHARGLAPSHGEAARQLLGRVSFVELFPMVLERALEPFPEPVRTLDALHLASIEFLRGRRLEIRLATYDRRMAPSRKRWASLLSRCSEHGLRSKRSAPFCARSSARPTSLRPASTCSDASEAVPGSGLRPDPCCGSARPISGSS